jgi:hypothetical protein
VDVISTDDVWAVGANTTCHFDGTGWSVIPSPQPRPQFLETAYELTDVSATGPDDVWVSGYRLIDRGEYLAYQSIAEHWDGRSWTVNFDVDGHTLHGIQALAPNDVWAVGTDGTRGLVVHFDGARWGVVPSPTPGNSGVLSDVEAESPGHLWAVGSAQSRSFVVEAPSRSQGTATGHTGVAFATVSWFGPASGSVQTDPGGGFAAAGLPAGTYLFTATEPGCTPAHAPVTVVAGTTVTGNLPIAC